MFNVGLPSVLLLQTTTAFVTYRNMKNKSAMVSVLLEKSVELDGYLVPINAPINELKCKTQKSNIPRNYCKCVGGWGEHAPAYKLKTEIKVNRKRRLSDGLLRPRRVARVKQNPVVPGASRRRDCAATTSRASANSLRPSHQSRTISSDCDEEEIPILVPIDYCEKSMQTLFPSGSKKTRKRLLSTNDHAEASSSLNKRGRKEEPLRQSRKRKMDAYQDLELHSMETQARRRKREAPPARRSNPVRRVSFTSRYIVGDFLGKGGFGSVYAGVRKADGKQVAIKYVLKNYTEQYITVPGESRRLPLEMALMEIVCKPPRCEHIVELLEWFEMPNCFILILERPVPCMDLSNFCEQHKGRLSEPLARVIMLQVVLAAIHCCERGVLHRDIKGENLLINTETLDVKFVDFGCGDLLKTGPYRLFAGTIAYCPPEWLLDGMYEGRPATVWSLGVLLFTLICGDLPFEKEMDIVEAQLRFNGRPSKACRKLIRWCLQQEPENRPALGEIISHEWFLEGLSQV